MLLFTCTLFSRASLLTLWHVSLTLLIFILDAKVTTNSWGYMPVVSQNVSDLPSIMCSGGYFGSAEDAKLTEVPAELKPMSNIFIATCCPHIKLACGYLHNNALDIMWFAPLHCTKSTYISSMSSYLRFQQWFQYRNCCFCKIANSSSMVTVLVELFHFQLGLICIVNWLY